MNRLRGRWHEFNGIPLMATYHPAYLLRNQSAQRKAQSLGRHADGPGKARPYDHAAAAGVLPAKVAG